MFDDRPPSILRHAESLDEVDTFSDEGAGERAYGDEFARVGVQHETDNSPTRGWAAHTSDAVVENAFPINTLLVFGSNGSDECS